MANARRKSPLVLVIEDNPDDMLLLRTAAHEVCPDITFVFQATGEAALAYLASDDASRGLPHLVLLDYRLPDMNGLELVRRIRSNPGLSHLKVIVLTSDGELKQMALQAGANGFVVKPMSFLGLLEAMRCIALDARDAAT